MEYQKPELVAVGEAASVVLGILDPFGDNPDPEKEHEGAGVLVGLDD